MAYTTINKSSSFMNNKLYTGNGGTNAITGVGFQPDFTWLKQRDGTRAHYLFDAVRGATKELNSNNSNDENTNANGLQSFNSDGFTLGSEGEMNENTATFASWSWKAGTTSGINTYGATITPTSYSFNQTAGFSILRYTGTGSQGKVAHGLGAIPAMVIIKRTNADGDSWAVKHQDYTTNSYYQYLNSNIAQTNAADNFTNIAPTDVFFYIETDGPTNTSGAYYVAYCFAEKTGYSKFSSYLGNNSTDGPMIYTGFKPSFVMIKNTSDTGNWVIQDNKRPGFNLTAKRLQPNVTTAEETDSGIDLLSNGFKVRSTGSYQNDNGFKYIYMAFGQTLVGTNNIPNNAF